MTKYSITMSSPDDERKQKHTELILLDGKEETVNHVALSWDNFRFTSTDPIFSSAKDFFKNAFKKRRYNSRRYRWSSSSFRNDPYGNDFDVSMTIKGLPISVQKEKARININGHHVSLDTMCGALAKVLVVSFHEDNVMKLFSTLNSFLNMPENIHYVLENKVPYYFYQGGRYGDKIEVRLNVKQIGGDDFALEISDGVWGEISTDDLNTFCNTYRHDKKRGNWTNLSPRDLFYRLIERNPSDSEHELMIEFLKQNRQGDIVEKRAMKLLDETLEKFKHKICAERGEEDTITAVYVRGQLYDWKIEGGAVSSDLQKVRVSVWQPYLVNCYTREGEKILDENGKHLQVHQQPHWRGPICIDNLATGSSMGDQYVSRIMSTMNDKMLVTLVKTIKSYLSGEPDTVRNKDLSSKLNRDDNNEM